MASKFVFIILLKSKYRWKIELASTAILIPVVLLSLCCGIASKGPQTCQDLRCVHGRCGNGTCLCDEGWQGEHCEFCGGKVSLDALNGVITDGPGNYSIDLHCTWLINSSQPNSTIRFSFHHFATECCWDHLYIFDGDSAYSPLLAAYSGVMHLENQMPNTKVSELFTSTGVAYIHFYSDTLYNMSGFNISYNVEMCPSNCSGKGVCINGICTCDAFWEGCDCSIPICPNNCGKGKCDPEAHRCVCDKEYGGEDCSLLKKDSYWEVLKVHDPSEPIGRASHAAVAYMDAMYIFCGERFRKEHYCDIWRFDFKIRSWTPIHPTFSTRSPVRRYGHSAVVYKNSVYIYGGVVFDTNITNELWRYDFEDNSWTRLQSDKADACQGHTATVVDNVMVVIFGYSHIYGYLNYIQQYNIDSKKWEHISTKGFLVKGGFGHSSAYDALTKKIYVHGGYHSESSSSYDLDDVLYVYDPISQQWNEKKRGISKRYLHSAVIISGLMLVYGGNIHNDTMSYHGSKCRSSNLLAYDIACNTWFELMSPSYNGYDYARYGHSAVVHNKSVYIFGGFNGEMLHDVLIFTAGNCNGRSYENCTRHGPGVKCWWNTHADMCELMNINHSAIKQNHFKLCSINLENDANDCGNYNTCSSCLQANLGCVWCNGVCSHKSCEIKQNSERSSHGIYNQLSSVAYQEHQLGINKTMECERNPMLVCGNLHNCQTCNREPGCTWNNLSQCKPVTDVLKKGIRQSPCQLPCSQYTTCQNCTQAQCLWCSTGEGRCIESNAYAPSFSFGQCMDWTTSIGKCPPPKCANIITCSLCQENVGCGWCDDNSKSGIGTCLMGGSKHPFKIVDGIAEPDVEACLTGWHFASCPQCQCNGHSTCTVQANECDQPCSNNTVGKHCEKCAEGFFGVPINGGNCTPCFCNDHGTLCAPDSGKCYCTTKGIIGNSCDRCDEANTYYGTPSNGGTCYYNLAVDYQFTFNLSKPEDHYYTQINFMNTPSKQDMDTDLVMECSVDASVNVTMKMASKPESAIITNQSCEHFKQRFSHSDYEFGTDENTTFYVYVYDFQTPLMIKITFSQSQKLDLLQFFITFSSCFLTLLIVAAVLWKIKQKYDLYRRRQQLFVEMEQMASRPFSSIFLAVDSYDKSAMNPLLKEIPNSNQEAKKKQKEHPSPIALEPCYNNKAAVLSLIMKMPMGDETYIPVGQSGITIASTLVTLGNARKRSLESHKVDSKGKGRKPLNHTHFDSCI